MHFPWCLQIVYEVVVIVFIKNIVYYVHIVVYSTV